MGKISRRILEYDLNVIILLVIATLVHVALICYSFTLYLLIIILPLSVISVFWYWLHMENK